MFNYYENWLEMVKHTLAIILVKALCMYVHPGKRLYQILEHNKYYTITY
jgi:hypothetical protein